MPITELPEIGEVSRRLLTGEYMSQEEAHFVYAATWGLYEVNPIVRDVVELLRILDRETTKGIRCSVCSRVNDPRCIEEC